MDDQLVAGALAKVNISAVPWPDCLSRWKCPVLNDPVTHAIVHPRYYGLNNAVLSPRILGTWEGVVQTDPVSRVRLNLSNSEGEAQAVIMRQDNEMDGLAVETIHESASILTFSLQHGQMRCQTRVNENATELEGHWLHGKGSFSVKFVKL